MDPRIQALVDHRRDFLGFLERRLGDGQLAADIFQEAFGRALDRLESLRDDESIVAWFYRTLRNAIIDHHRRHASADRALARLADELSEGSPPDADAREVVCRCVSRLAATLKPEYREALEALDVAETSLAEFAAARGITRQNAAVRAHRARQALREEVRAACGACAAHGCLDCTCRTSAAKL